MMLITVIIIAFVLLAALLMLARSSRSAANMGELSTRFHDIDALAFKRLIDSDDIAAVRAAVSAKAFRRLQRKRASIAFRYLNSIAHNAALLMTISGFAEALEQKSTAADLEREALQVRILALRAQAAVSIWFIFPGAKISLPLFSQYSTMRGHFDQLVRASNQASAAATAV